MSNINILGWGLFVLYALIGIGAIAANKISSIDRVTWAVIFFATAFWICMNLI